MISTDVHVGRDGWLFLVGGTNRPIRFYRRDLASWRLLRGWQRLIEARRARCVAEGRTFLHVVVPEKLSIYDDRTDGLRIDPALGPARRLARRLAGSEAGEALVDLVAPMRAARDGPDLYYRTDSHWTFAGCHLAYREICRRLGAAPVPDLAERSHRLDDDRAGDLGMKFEPPRRERMAEYWFLRDAARCDANARARAVWDGTLDSSSRVGGARTSFRNENPAADPRRVVLFGDSYAETIANRLSGMLAETFRELHFVWSTSLDWDFVDALRPDILITELAERFLTRLPDDRYVVASVP